MSEKKSINFQAFKFILTHWKENKNEEKFIFYNPYTNKIVLGSNSFKKNETEENDTDYCNAPFTLYPYTFFDDNSQSKVFKKYLIVEDGKIIYNSFCSNVTDIHKADSFKQIIHKVTRINDSYEDWKDIFNTIQNKISENEFIKVVVSRKVEFRTKEEFEFSSIFLNLYENNPNCFIFAYDNTTEIFFGASPELLVEKKADKIKSFALAGTVKKEMNHVHEQGIEFLKDEKNSFEHQLVIESISNTMQELGNDIEVGNRHILELKNLLHIKTDICATDKENNLQEKNTAFLNENQYAKINKYRILDWVNKLHPTPALGGSPKNKALEFIKQHEKFERRHYGAPFGLVDQNGDGIFIVGIRSAVLCNNSIYAYAGCGIVAKSDCNEEYEEIDTKLKTIIEAL